MRKARALHPGLCSVVETRNDQKSIPLEPLESLSNLADPRYPHCCTHVPGGARKLAPAFFRSLGTPEPR